MAVDTSDLLNHPISCHDSLPIHLGRVNNHDEENMEKMRLGQKIRVLRSRPKLRNSF